MSWESRKSLSDRTQTSESVPNKAEAGEVVIRPARSPREGWDEIFRNMAARGDDRLLDEANFTEFDEGEWTW